MDFCSPPPPLRVGGVAADLCVCAFEEEGGVAGNESNGAQKRPVMHRGGGVGGASPCLSHTYSLRVIKKVSPARTAAPGLLPAALWVCSRLILCVEIASLCLNRRFKGGCSRSRQHICDCFSFV